MINFLRPIFRRHNASPRCGRKIKKSVRPGALVLAVNETAADGRGGRIKFVSSFSLLLHNFSR
jgi:hypothetical protein